MVEVFKTNITNKTDAAFIVSNIHERFPSYSANFDLQDCDRILRVKCITGRIKSTSLVKLVITFGYHAEVLIEHQTDDMIVYPDLIRNKNV